MATLKIQNISFKRENKPILTNINFQFSEKKIIGLIGNSGIGKSTLANIIAGHLKADQGKIFLEDKEVLAPTREIIIVHQEDDLFPWLTVEGQLDFVNFNNFPKEEIDKLLEHFSLVEFKSFYPYQLSGGMKKRLSLLRALIINPKWIILDEALSSLDKETALKILDTIIPFSKKKNIGLIIITHQNELFSNYLDEVIRI